MDSRRLGRAIRQRRGALNLTQPDLAERAEVSLAYLYMLEVGGLPQPEPEPLARVAGALGYARLVTLLEEVCHLTHNGPVPPSVVALATAEAVDQFLRELPSLDGLPAH
jgi:transcriptional regulator with XRE-family HTH domain